MLQSMRQITHSWVVKGLMLFLIISFSIWGIGDIFRGNPLQKAVAKVGNTTITVQEMNKLFETTLAQARQKIAPNLTSQQARQMGLLDKSLTSEIERRLVDMDIKRLGINVSAKEVLTLVTSQPQFRTKDGSFNKQMFRQILEQQRLTEAGFIAQGQQEMSRQLLLGALGGSHVVSQTATDALYQSRAQKRILDVVSIDASKIGGIPTPDDKALQEFYDKNQPMFAAPEYRSITIALLSTEAVTKEITVSEEQLKKEYEAKPDLYAHAERRNVVQVVVQDEAKAKQLSVQAFSSGNLNTAAKEAKETAVPLDQLEEKNLMPELSKVVFALGENEIGGPVKTQLGWHVLQLKKIIPAGRPSFAEVKDRLREDMLRDQGVEATTRIVNQLDDQLAAGHSLDDIADSLKLRLVKIPAIDATGLLPDGKAPTELPNKEDVLKSAFAQNAGETSPVEDDKAGTYFVVRTEDVTPSGPRPFDTVKAKVASLWKAHEQGVKAQAEADKIVKALREGKPASAFNGDEGVSSRTTMPLSQLGDADPLLPPDIMAQAFKLKKGETATAATDKLYIARLSSIIDVDASKPDPRKNMIVSELRKNNGEEIIDQYLRHLYNVFPVKTDVTLLDHLRQLEN